MLMTMMKKILLLLLLPCQMVLAQSPMVLSTFPMHQGENLSCSTPIFFTIEYSTEGNNLRMETFKDPNIKLYPKGKPRKSVPIRLEYDQYIQKVMVKPQELLLPDTWYILEVSDQLKDDRGMSFSPYKLEFRTGDCKSAKGKNITEEVDPALKLDPIEVTNFKAEKFQDSLKITWEARESLLIENYFIEKSTDGKLYTYLGSVPAMGALEESHSYIFYDPYPASGESFYRLGSKYSLDEARLLDTLKHFASGVQFPDRRIRQDETLPLLFYNKKPTSMVFVLKESESGKVVFRQAKLLPAGKTKVVLSLGNVEKGFYVALIQTTEIAVKTKIQIE